MRWAWKMAASFDGEPIKPVINLLAAAVSVSSCKSNQMLKEWKMQRIVMRHGPCFFFFFLRLLLYKRDRIKYKEEKSN